LKFKIQRVLLEFAIMTEPVGESLVSVYSTPLAFDAEMVKAMLADEEIPGTVENSSGPFPGLSTIPCEVLVGVEHEVMARELIAEHEERHRARVELESEEGEAGDDMGEELA
jgi:hypothetical protein